MNTFTMCVRLLRVYLHIIVIIIIKFIANDSELELRFVDKCRM